MKTKSILPFNCKVLLTFFLNNKKKNYVDDSIWCSELQKELSHFAKIYQKLKELWKKNQV
jgi:hypothetical protein